MPPINLLIKPVSGSCNMRCCYCFYTDEMANREQACYGRMSDETLEAGGMYRIRVEESDVYDLYGELAD